MDRFIIDQTLSLTTPTIHIHYSSSEYGGRLEKLIFVLPEDEKLYYLDRSIYNKLLITQIYKLPITLSAINMKYSLSTFALKCSGYCRSPLVFEVVQCQQSIYGEAGLYECADSNGLTSVKWEFWECPRQEVNMEFPPLGYTE